MPEVKGYEVNFASYILPFFEIFMSWNMSRNSKNAGNSMKAFILIPLSFLFSFSLGLLMPGRAGYPSVLRNSGNARSFGTRC